MITALTVTVTDAEIEEIVAGFDSSDKEHKAKLATEIGIACGLSYETGGWFWKITFPNSGGAKLVGSLVPNRSVVA